MSINLKQILFNLSHLTVANVMAKVAGFIFLVAMARTYGAYEYGIFTLVSTCLMFAMIFADFGLDYFAIRLFHEDSNAHAFKAILKLKFVLALIACVGVNIAVRLIYKDSALSQYVLLLSVTIFPDALFKIITAYFRSQNDFRKPAVVMMGFNVARILLAVAIMNVSVGLRTVFLAILAFEFVKCVALLGLFRNKMSLLLDAKLSKAGSVRKILRDAFPFALGSVSGIVLWQADIYLISYVKGFRDAGVYSAANAVLGAVVDLPLMLATAIFPNLLDTSVPQMKKGFFSIVKWVVPLAVAAACALFLTAPWIMGLLFKMHESAQILQILCWSVIPVAIYSVMAPFIYKLGGVLELSYITIFGVLYVTALDLILLPSFDLWIAALVDITAEFLLLLCYTFSLKKRLAQT